MALSIAANVTFDVYRGYNSADPYAPPNRPAVLPGQKGFLRQHVRNGRFGFTPAGSQALHWTTILDLDPTLDVRSAWNSEQNTFHEAQGDTVMVFDYPTLGTCCAFCVVMVQLRAARTPRPYLRAYLDRARPLYGTNCNALVVPRLLRRRRSLAPAGRPPWRKLRAGKDKPPPPPPSGDRVSIPCCPGGQLAPKTIVGRISGTSGGSACLQGAQFNLDYHPSVDSFGNPGYQGVAPTGSCPSNVGQLFQLICGGTFWSCRQSCGVNWNSIGANLVNQPCNPLAMTFTTAANGCYGGGFTITLSET
jgi:hypothetical protein